MKKNVILLTNNFPYGKGEEFLETEIKYLSEAFDKIVIISIDKKSPKTRDLPEEVIYDRFKRRVISFYYLFKLVKMFFIELNLLYNKYKKLNFLNIKHLLSYIKFASINAKQIEDCLKKYKLNPNETIIYSYWANQNILAALMLKDKMPELVCVTRAHGYDLYEERQTGNYLPFRNYIYKNVDFIFTISDQGKNYLVERYGSLVESKIETARLGVKKVANNIDIKPSKKENELFIVSCSYLSPVKRIDLLIEELAKVDDIKIKWRHIGSGILWDELNQLAQNLLSSKKNIDFKFMGHQKNSDIYKFYSDHHIDLFVNVSESEGIPVSFMEAQSFGIPIIATNVGGVSEIVNNNNGYLIDKDFSNGTIGKCLRDYILKSEHEKYIMRQNAYNSWMKKYNADRNYREFMKKLLTLD